MLFYQKIINFIKVLKETSFDVLVCQKNEKKQKTDMQFNKRKK